MNAEIKRIKIIKAEVNQISKYDYKSRGNETDKHF